MSSFAYSSKPNYGKVSRRDGRDVVNIDCTDADPSQWPTTLIEEAAARQVVTKSTLEPASPETVQFWLRWVATYLVYEGDWYNHADCECHNYRRLFHTSRLTIPRFIAEKQFFYLSSLPSGYKLYSQRRIGTEKKKHGGIDSYLFGKFLLADCEWSEYCS